MNSVLMSVLGLLVTLGVLIAFHEFGHYWVAKRCGVKVLRFSIGFGKPIWMRRLGADQTEYVLAAIPLGGYVKMLDEREGDVAPDELHRSFNQQSLAKRVAIVSAGPIFNFIFAVFAYFLMFVIGVPGIKPVIGEVVEDSVAQQAGFRSGDRIESVADQATPTWNTTRMTLLQESLDRDVVPLVVVSDDGSRHELNLNFSGISTEEKQQDLIRRVGILQYRIPVAPILDRVIAGAAAERDGLKVGDKIVSANGLPMLTWRDWVKVIESHAEKPMQIELLRNGELQTLTVTPKGQSENGKIVGKIGAAVKMPDNYKTKLEAMRILEKYPVFDSVGLAFVKTWQMSVLTLRMIGKMLTGEVSVKNLSGPITIATYAGITVSIGFSTFLSFLAVVSIGLGVLNLLPI
ncbi:MAG: RIP metalloprotease RseP, partial [Thiohalomonadales bacterium]